MVLEWTVLSTPCDERIGVSVNVESLFLLNFKDLLEDMEDVLEQNKVDVNININCRFLFKIKIVGWSWKPLASDNGASEDLLKVDRGVLDQF